MPLALPTVGEPRRRGIGGVCYVGEIAAAHRTGCGATERRSVSGLGPLPRLLGLVFLAGALGGPVRGLLSVYVESTLRQPPAFSSLLLSLLLVGAGIFAVVGGALSDRL